jgi:alpha-glucosidase (family GH31 glycosyl hydrolase)
LAFENNQKGTPLMRPLFFDEPTNSAALNNNTVYLWGDDFLVSPVVSSGLKQQEVSFPSNANWYNFYTGEKVEGGQTVLVNIVEESIPTYVRGGAFIPMIQTIQNTTKYDLNNFDLHFYYDENVNESESKLYNDDGETPNAFGKGMYEIITFENEKKSKGLEIEIEQEIGENFEFTSKEIQLIIHNISKAPKKVKGYNYTWDKETKRLNIKVSLDNKTSKNIIIKL